MFRLVQRSTAQTLVVREGGGLRRRLGGHEVVVGMGFDRIRGHRCGCRTRGGGRKGPL